MKNHIKSLWKELAKYFRFIETKKYFTQTNIIKPNKKKLLSNLLNTFSALIETFWFDLDNFYLLRLWSNLQQSYWVKKKVKRIWFRLKMKNNKWKSMILTKFLRSLKNICSSKWKSKKTKLLLWKIHTKIYYVLSGKTMQKKNTNYRRLRADTRSLKKILLLWDQKVLTSLATTFKLIDRIWNTKNRINLLKVE